MADRSNSGFLVRRFGSTGDWTSPDVEAYANEDHLQRVIAATPGHVPGVSADALTVREFSTSAGPADVCIVDLDGSITVVECKLASNSERRRMVIGQVLDYASAICVEGESWFSQEWARQGGLDLRALGDSSLGQLGHNIEFGRVHLCLVVDRIDADLRRLVEYLNRITRDEIRVTALQLAYARHGNLEFLVPSAYGAELAAAKAKTAGAPRNTTTWTKESFLDAIGSDDDRRRAHSLFVLQESLDDSRGDHDDFWFGASPNGSIFFHPYGYRYPPMSLWINKSGELMTYGSWGYFRHIARHEGFAGLAELLGQDRLGPATGRRVSDLDIDAFWAAVLRCAVEIND